MALWFLGFHITIGYGLLWIFLCQNLQTLILQNSACTVVFYSFRISANCYYRSYSKKVQNTTTDYQTNFDAFFMRFLAYDVRVYLLRAKEQKSTKICLNKIPSLLLQVKYVWDGVVSCCFLLFAVDDFNVSKTRLKDNDRWMVKAGW